MYHGPVSFIYCCWPVALLIVALANWHQSYPTEKERVSSIDKKGDQQVYRIRSLILCLSTNLPSPVYNVPSTIFRLPISLQLNHPRRTRNGHHHKHRKDDQQRDEGSSIQSCPHHQRASLILLPAPQPEGDLETTARKLHDLANALANGGILTMSPLQGQPSTTQSLSPSHRDFQFHGGSICQRTHDTAGSELVCQLEGEQTHHPRIRLDQYRGSPLRVNEDIHPTRRCNESHLVTPVQHPVMQPGLRIRCRIFCPW